MGKNCLEMVSMFVSAMQSGRCPALCGGFASCDIGGITGNPCGAQCDVSLLLASGSELT